MNWTQISISSIFTILISYAWYLVGRNVQRFTPSFINRLQQPCAYLTLGEFIDISTHKASMYSSLQIVGSISCQVLPHLNANTFHSLLHMHPGPFKAGGVEFVSLTVKHTIPSSTGKMDDVVQFAHKLNMLDIEANIAGSAGLIGTSCSQHENGLISETTFFCEVFVPKQRADLLKLNPEKAAYFGLN